MIDINAVARRLPEYIRFQLWRAISAYVTRTAHRYVEKCIKSNVDVDIPDSIQNEAKRITNEFMAIGRIAGQSDKTKPEYWAAIEVCAKANKDMARHYLAIIKCCKISLKKNKKKNR